MSLLPYDGAGSDKIRAMAPRQGVKTPGSKIGRRPRKTKDPNSEAAWRKACCNTPKEKTPVTEEALSVAPFQREAEKKKGGRPAVLQRPQKGDAGTILHRAGT